MNNRIRLVSAGIGVLSALCSCTVGTKSSGDWEFPLVKADHNSTARKTLPSNPQRRDPFRSPDVTSLPERAPTPQPAPTPGPTPSPTPEN